MTLTALMGGEKALGLRPRSPRDWHRLISHGVSSRSAEAVKHNLAIADSTLASLLGISPKTMARARKTGQPLDASASDRLFRLARIVAMAHRVLENPDAAVNWLKRPQPGLANEIPLQLLSTEAGATEVERLLQRIEFGVYS